MLDYTLGWPFYLLTFMLALVLTPIIIRFAVKFRYFDSPGFRKVHKRPIPRLGGVAIYLSFWAGWGVLCLQYPQLIPYEASSSLWYIFFASTLIWFLGLYDDIYGASAPQKLFIQSIAAGIVIYGGIDIKLLQNPVGHDAFLLSPSVSLFLTFAWIVVVSNAINLIDGLDGLAGGVCLITCLTIAVISRKLGIPHLPFLSLCLAAACLGFLIFNFAPARIFLGDSGSLFLGFMLACLSISGTTKRSTAIVMFGPPLILALPVLDAALAVFRRFLGADNKGGYSRFLSLSSLMERFASIFKADQEHIHHSLLKIGLSHRRAVLILYVVTTILGVTAYQSTVKEHMTGTLVVFAVLALLLIWLRRKAFPQEKSGIVSKK